MPWSRVRVQDYASETERRRPVVRGLAEPSDGLEHANKPILPRQLLLWAGSLALGGATLGVISWADHYGNGSVAFTMGLTTFGISNVVFSVTARDERRSVFSLDVLEDRILLYCTAGGGRRT
jgi:hypothetical protein